MEIPPDGIPIKKVIYKVVIPFFAILYAVGFYWTYLNGTAGILDMNSSRKTPISKKERITILGTDDTRRDFVVLEETDSKDLIMRVVNYNGHVLDERAVSLQKNFNWRRCMYALSPDHTRLAYFTWDAVIVHDLRNSEETEILKAKKYLDLSPHGLKWVSNSEIIFQGTVDSLDAHIIKYDVNKKKIVDKIKFEDRPEYFIFQESKYTGLIFSRKHEVIIFDPDRMEVINTHKYDSEAMLDHLCLSPSGRRIAYTEFRGSNKLNTIKITDLDTGEERKYYRCHAFDLSFLDDDTLVYTHHNRFNPFSMGVRKLDVNTGSERVLARPISPPMKLFGIDNGSKLLFSAW